MTAQRVPKRMARWKTFIALTALAVAGTAAVSLGQRPEAGEQSVDTTAEPLLETFVLTPIHTKVTGFPVPADVLGPVTNNSCQDWTQRAYSCYMPSFLHSQEVPTEAPWLHTLLEAHLSALLDAWNIGAWPPDGASIIYSLRQYNTLLHLWLSMHIDIRQEISGVWLTEAEDPKTKVNAAATQPAASIDIEVFGSTRNAEGYPQRRGL